MSPQFPSRSRLLAGLLFLTGLLFAQGRPASDRPLALVGGTVYVGPSEDSIRDGVILIENGVITMVGSQAAVQIPAGIETLDCSGLIVTAGFWNCHVHFMERKWAAPPKIPERDLIAQLQEMLTRYGYTSVFDTGSLWENTRQLRDRIESGDVAGPRIRSTGVTLVPKGGSPPELVLDIKGAMRIRTPEIANAAEARVAAKKLLDSGADGIKLYAATWAPPIVTLPEVAIKAAVKEAHARGKPVFAHPSNREGLLASVRGGADILVHTAPQAGIWDEALLAEMKQSGIALIPTLKLWHYELKHDRISARERFVRNGVAQLRAWLAVGGVVLFGTDVGYMSDYDPSDEYALLAEAGMSFRQILASLTVLPAERFGESERLGRIAQGFVADLVVLDRDPSQDVRAFASVRYTLRDGRVIYSSSR